MSDGWNGRLFYLKEKNTLDEMHRPQKRLVESGSAFCNNVGIRQNEFYQAAAQGYRVEQQLEVRRNTYKREFTHVRYNGTEYRILRTANAKCRENIIIVCVDKVNSQARKV